MTEKTVKTKKKGKMALRNSDLEMLIGSKGLANLRRSRDLPIAFSFRLADLLGRLQPTIKAYSEQKQKLIDKYGDRDKEGKLVEQSPNVFVFSSKAQWFQKEFSELLSMEIQVDCARLEIGMEDIPKETISTNDIIALMPIIDFREATTSLNKTEG